MTDEAIISDWTMKLERHVKGAADALDSGKAQDCPAGNHFPAIVMCLGGLRLEELKNRRTRKPIFGFQYEGRFGKIAASGVTAVVLVLAVLVVYLTLSNGEVKEVIKHEVVKEMTD